MPTTIDSLQIEIQSSSTSAAKGIRDLSQSLGELKTHGTINVAIKNLNNLKASLNGLNDASKPASAISMLADSLAKLKGVGSIGSVGKNITKLTDGLKALDKINIDNVAPQIQRIADAVTPLSATKSGGINTMVNGLLKIGKATAALDDKAIAAFADRIARLNTVLEPLSAKMTTIQAGLRGINTKSRSAGSSVRQMGEDVNASALNLSSFVTVMQEAVSWLQQAIQRFTDFISAAIEWDGIAARFGRGFGAQASETYAWIQRLNEEMGINVQQFMQYSSVYATMLTGFGVANEDAAKMALGYTELTYDIWAGYNDIYASFDEAAEAIRSAIAGEVEPIRRAGFTIIESTLEQTAANHGLTVSIENATEAQKSYLRYLTLVDQANSQGLVGTYAKELNTAEGLMRTFSQQLKSLAQAFGSLFLPILVKVMPYLQAFVELLTEGVKAIAAMLGITIQSVDWSGYNAGVGSAVENTENVSGALKDAAAAAKELKNASIGIDELNVISPSSASSGAGSGGSGGLGGNGFSDLDIDSLWDESIFANIGNQVEEIKAKIKEWLPVISTVAVAIAGLTLTHFLDDIAKAVAGMSTLGKVASVISIAVTVGKIVWDFTGAYLEGGSEVDLLKALGSTTIGVALAYWLGGKPGAAFVLSVSGIVTLTRLAVEIGNGTVEWDDTESLVTGLVGGLETVIGGILTWKTIGPIVKKAWPKVVEKAAPLLAKAGPWGWIAAGAVAGITLSLVDYDFTEVGYSLGEKIGSALSSGWKLIRDGVSKAFKYAADNLDVDDLWDVLSAPLNIFDKLKKWIEEKVENLRSNLNEFFGGFFDGFFDGLGLDVSWAKEFAGVFDIDYVDIVEMVVNPMTIGKHIINGIKEGLGIGDLFESVKKKFTDFISKVKNFFGIKSPSTLMRDEIGKNLVSGIVSGMDTDAIKNKLSPMWTSAKNWWNDKKGNLKTYTPSIGSIYDKLKERWDNARTWWNDKKTKAKEYTPSIGSIYEKAKERWDNARTWWNSKKAAMKTYTPSIGSIVDKVKSAWNSAKSWWSKNVGGLSTKLNISVPKIKVQWDTATAFGKSFKYPTGFKLEFAAAGGIFDAGSLIWAGERGAEIVANAGGGKTGVMNVQQMQDAVYNGVYAAVSAAMRGQQAGGSDVNVYLDGRKITATVERHQRERGATIMGNEVYSH